jgi:hypothetical protein
MFAVRIIGILLALGGMAFFLTGLLSGNTGANSDSLTAAVFAMVAGLIVALGADAGQKLEQRSKDAKAKKTEKK